MSRCGHDWRVRHGFTLVEVGIVLVLIAVLTAVGMYVFRRAKQMPPAALCMTNLHGMGKALAIYQEDNDDGFPWIVGTDAWETAPTGTNATIDPAAGGDRSVSALPFLLLRSGHPKRMFICPAVRDATADEDTRQVSGAYKWDFSRPVNLSYSWQAPLRRQDGQYVQGLTDSLTGDAIFAADKTPVYDAATWTPPDWSNSMDERTRLAGLSRNHAREGQIHFLRASVTIGKSDRADVGVDGDNIYSAGGPSRAGVMGIENHTDPNDSYLIGPVR